MTASTELEHWKRRAARAEGLLVDLVNLRVLESGMRPDGTLPKRPAPPSYEIQRALRQRGPELWKRALAHCASLRDQPAARELGPVEE